MMMAGVKMCIGSGAKTAELNGCVVGKVFAGGKLGVEYSSLEEERE
jgi:hypothetical protein